MAFLIFFVFMLTVTAILAVIVGKRMPRDHVAAVYGIYNAAPEAVWALISDPTQSATWRGDVKRVDKLPRTDGRLAWKEMTDRGVTTYEMVEAASI